MDANLFMDRNILLRRMKASIIVMFILLFCLCVSYVIDLRNLEDPFGFERITLHSHYALERFSQGGGSHDDLYNIIDKREVKNLGGVFGGIIKKINLQDENVYVWVQKCYGGDRDGIYKLDFNTGVVTGPLSIIDSNKAFIDTHLFFEDNSAFFSRVFKAPKL